MSTVLVLMAILAGFLFGIILGVTWGRLPRLVPGQVVRFRADHPGGEYRLMVHQIVRDAYGVSVELGPLRETTQR